MAIGVTLQAAGLLVALSGLSDLSDVLFPNASPLPPRRIWRRVRRVFGRHPETATIPATAAAGFGGAFNARGQGTKARPADWAGLLAWSAYLVSEVDALKERLDDLATGARAVETKLRQEIQTETRDRVEADAQLAERLQMSLAGKDGRGLRKTWFGLALTLVGVVVAGIAALFM